MLLAISEPNMYTSDMELTIGEQLSTARKRRGMSQSDVSRSAGISSNTIGKIERGDVSPTAKQLAALSTAIGAELTLKVL